MANKATISMLPTEVKTRIAQICQIQDERIRRNFQHLDFLARRGRPYCVDDDGEEVEDDGGERSAWTEDRHVQPDYPRSLSALASASREWRAVTAPIIFRDMTAYKCARPSFGFAIGPKYGRFVETFNFNLRSDDDSAMNVIGALALMPNIRSIDLSFVDHLFERLREQMADQQSSAVVGQLYAQEAIQRVAEHAHTVSIRNQITVGLQYCVGTAITTLNVRLGSGDLAPLCAALDRLPNLRTLKIASDSSDNIYEQAAQITPFVSPAVRQLDIHWFPRDSAGVFSFLRFFSSTAEHLRLTPQSMRRSDQTLPIPADFTMPHVQVLDLDGRQPAFGASITRQITPITWPSLREVRWRLPSRFDSAGPAEIALLTEALRVTCEQQTARTGSFRYVVSAAKGYDAGLLQDSFIKEGVYEAARKGGVDLQIEGSDSTALQKLVPPKIILQPLVARDGDGDPDALADDVVASLERIRALTEQARAVGDRVQLARLGQALQGGEWLWVERQS
ncbi:hypothetical protein JCM10908_002266 [Rhodotorula pacifica]|uniref:uncharacterized protein n=1 Tax=Rhodotorula pacifica TaxID=1495444 RepID=UPI00317786F4